MIKNFSFDNANKVIISNFSGRLELLPKRSKTGIEGEFSGSEESIKEISLKNEGNLLTIADEAIPNPNAYFELSEKVLKVYVPKDAEVEIHEASGITYVGELENHCKALSVSIKKGTLTVESASDMILEVSGGDVKVNNLTGENTVNAKESTINIKFAVGKIIVCADNGSYIRIRGIVACMKISANNGSTVKVQCGKEIDKIIKTVSSDSRVIIKQNCGGKNE